MRKRLLKNIDWKILLCTIVLLVIGLLAIYSADANIDSGEDEFKKQIMWILICIPVVITLILIDYRTIAKYSLIYYIICLIFLVAVLFTTPISGATSWFTIGDNFSIQPSEFSKIAVILFLAYVINKMKMRNGKKEINRPIRLLLICLIFMIPLLLIIKQPDYGTATAFIVAFVLMLFAAGIDKKYIITGILILAIAIPLLYFYVLPPHAKKRIDVFLNPESDPRGAGYNLTQSKIAIGSGRLFGMGYLKGNQTQLGFLYPKSTDFIFSVIGEELGFVVTAAIVVTYVILIIRALNIAKTAPDDLGSLIATGIAGILLFHMTENIGMTIGLLPITGVPLPFVSYGGSSLLSNLIMIALLLNISARRQKTIFFING